MQVVVEIFTTKHTRVRMDVVLRPAMAGRSGQSHPACGWTPSCEKQGMYFVYILQSKKDKSFYIGQTGDLDARLMRHNLGTVKSTRSKVPHEIIYKEAFRTRGEAMRREKEIKSYKGGNAFKKLLGQL